MNSVRSTGLFTYGVKLTPLIPLFHAFGGIFNLSREGAHRGEFKTFNSVGLLLPLLFF
jgi:hypothetical protein